jgi:subtilisin-like proprotein convertase family protein
VLLIPDNAAAGVESHLELTGGGTVAGIRVHADVIHSFIGDLSIALVSPAGRRVVLRDRAGADDLHETWTPATTPALSDLVGRAVRRPLDPPPHRPRRPGHRPPRPLAP